MSGGSFEDPLQGVRLDGIQARILAQGEEVLIERASATTRNGGTLVASGRVRLAPDAGFPGAFRIQGNRVLLVSNETMQTIADLSLEFSGALAERPRVNGRVDIVSLDVAVPDRIPVTSQPLAGTKHVDATKTATARVALDKKAKARGKRKPAFDADIDLTIAAPNRVFVRGRGIDAELGGDIRLSGTMAQPIAIGAFEMRRGRLSVLSQRLDFIRGRLTFSGELSPELDFVAETRVGDLTAQIAVSGQASQPTFAFTSQPDLPQDEVLSRIMFQKASGGLSTTQALQLAATAAQFAGEGGNDAFEMMRKSLGVNSLDIQMRAGKPTVGASRYISDNVSVGVRTGATPEQSAVSVDIDVTRGLRVQGEVGVDGRSTIGLGTEWEY
jgi:translocation and assembly module TamB